MKVYLKSPSCFAVIKKTLKALYTIVGWKGLNKIQFFFKVRCFYAATTIFYVPERPFFCLIFYKMFRAPL